MFKALVAVLGLMPFAVSAQNTVTILVGQGGSNYAPATVSCTVGDTVLFQWVAGNHPTQSDDGTTIPLQNLDGLSPATTVYKVKMTAAGTVPYFCTAHGAAGGVGMSGVITVTPAVSNTPLFTDNFAGTPGTLLNAQGWTPTPTVSTLNQIFTETPALTYTGHTLSGSGNSVVLRPTGEDVNRVFTSSAITSGSVYASFLIKVDSVKASGDYFFHLGPNPIATDFKGRVFIKPNGTGFQIGISKATASANYDPTVYSFGTTMLVVVKYSIVSGATNDLVSIFVNPTLGGTEPTASASAVVSEADIATAGIGTVALRQGTLANSVGLRFGALMVGQSWASVTPLNNVVVNPKVRFTTALQNVNENAGTATLTVGLTDANTSATSVDVVVKGGTATVGSDYTYSTQTVTFPANSTTAQTVTVTIVDDAVQENDETIEFVLRNATNNAEITADSVHTLTIDANDQVSPTFNFVAPTAVSLAEGSGSYVFHVSTSIAPSTASSVTVAVQAASTATQGSDYTYSTQTLHFPSGSTSNQGENIVILEDQIPEGAETIILVLRDATNGALIGNDSTLTITIPTNDQPVVVHFTATTANVNENAGSHTASIMVMGMNSNNDTTRFDVALKSSTATAGADFTYITRHIEIPPHKDSTVNIVVPIINDTDIENDENFVLVIRNITNNGVIAADSMQTVTIKSDDMGVTPIAVLRDVDANFNPTFPLNTPLLAKGIVYSGNMRLGGLQFVLVDPTDGITVFKASGDLGYTATEGDSIAVYGKLSPFNGLNEIAADSIKVISSGHALKPARVITQLDESAESNLVKLKGVHLVDPSQWTGSGSGFNVKVTTGGADTIEVRIVNAVDLYADAAPVGIFDVTGVGGQYDATDPKNSGYQLMPRKRADIEVYPTISFSLNTATVLENVGSAAVSFDVSTPSSSLNSSVDVVVVGGTATTGTDYNFTSPVTVSFTGNSASPISLAIIDDSEVESTETIVLGFTNPVNCLIGTINAQYTLNITDNDFIGVNNNKAAAFKMYPNPTSADLFIHSDETIRQVIVYNALGQVVRNVSSLNFNDMMINVSDLAKGMYSVKVLTDKSESVQRVIIK